MRLFVAIDVPTAVKDHLAFLQRSLDHIPGPKWVHPKNIHLTLNFLGDVNSPDDIVDKLKTISFDSFSLKLSQCGFLPSVEDPRILWVSLEENKGLSSLQRSVDLLFTPEKSFKPHLTLARMRKTTEPHIRQLVVQVQKLDVKPLSFKVTQFKLFRSTLTPMGPIYEVLETFKSQ